MTVVARDVACIRGVADERFEALRKKQSVRFFGNSNTCHQAQDSNEFIPFLDDSTRCSSCAGNLNGQVDGRPGTLGRSPNRGSELDKTCLLPDSTSLIAGGAMSHSMSRGRGILIRRSNAECSPPASFNVTRPRPVLGDALSPHFESAIIAGGRKTDALLSLSLPAEEAKKVVAVVVRCISVGCGVHS